MTITPFSMRTLNEENENCCRRFENRSHRPRKRLHECNPCCVFSLQTGSKVIAVANMLFWGVSMIFTMIPIIVLSLSYYAITTNRVEGTGPAEGVFQTQRDFFSQLIFEKKITNSGVEAAAIGYGIGLNISVILFMLALQAAFFTLAIMLFQGAEKSSYKTVNSWLIVSAILFALTLVFMIGLLATEETIKENVVAVFSVGLIYQAYCFYVVKLFHSQLANNDYDIMNNEVIEL